VLYLVRSNPLKSTERYCFLYTGSDVAVHCRGFGCMCFVRVPIRRYKVGGSESHEWRGCMYVLEVLAEVAKVSGISLDLLLSVNR
jgi:hypothetical protein